MAGPANRTPQPTEIKLHQQSRLPEIAFADGTKFSLPCEFLRAYSPSAEVRGHSPGKEVNAKRQRLMRPAGIIALPSLFTIAP